MADPRVDLDSFQGVLHAGQALLSVYRIGRALASSRILEHLRAIVYTWSSCSFCRRAKELLAARGIGFREVVLDGEKSELRRLQQLFGARTMPLVVLDGERLAGLDALERALREE